MRLFEIYKFKYQELFLYNMTMDIDKGAKTMTYKLYYQNILTYGLETWMWTRKI